MLTCPHCRTRIRGEDLVSGVCSSCKARLTASADSSIVNATMLSQDSDDSGPLFLSGQLDPNSEIKTLDLDPASLPGGGNEKLQISMPEGLDDDSVELVGTSAEAPSDAGSKSAAPVDPSLATDQTFASDVAPPERTIEVPTDSSDSVYSADTIAKTYVADHFATQDDQEENQQTIVGSQYLGDENDESIAATFVSDNADGLMKTIQSQWGDEDEANVRTMMTMRGKEADKLRSPKSTLIIKTRQMRQVSTGPMTAHEEPEYELIRVLGEGGMGVVYSARQTSIDRDVAVKMLKPGTADNEKQRQKFIAEAVVTGDLDHPNIVPIYDIGRNDGGFLFYSMKKVQGTPWSDVIGEKSQVENLEILMKSADAIAFAHARGVVHRDLKPENIMLGSFGEVLVMDWGLALLLPQFRKRGTLADSTSMGGTPAYMAPEMATGPLDRITTASDIYLLGAILFEILTGKPPHTGKTAMKCLMAAARNEMIPTEKTGELMDIALKAMATNPADRYRDIKTFQTAIREYQSHSESILLSNRADDDLIHAQQADDYQLYARALFAFDEAVQLWSGNRRAATGAIYARRLYADSALRKGDYDLGLSVTHGDEPEHKSVREKLLAAQKEREARQQRLKAVRRTAIGLAATIFLVVSVAAVWINYEADKARKAESLATKERDNAVQQKQLADEQRQRAVIGETKAREAEAEALVQKTEAQKQQEIAETERDKAEQRRLEAESAREKEVLAKQAEEYEAYIARIGLAAAKISENSFDAAREILEGCKPELRNWEWGRLAYLCTRSQRTFTADAPLDTLAVNESSQLLATGGWNGTAVVWNRASSQILQTIRPGGDYVFAVALSPDGRHLVTGSDLRTEGLKLWNVETGELVRTYRGHEDAITSADFSQDGRRLLTASYDGTARLWDVDTGETLQTYRAHTWWVWSARFSPDEQQIVTASQDGSALVWQTKTGKPRPAFTGHSGPVYVADFAKDGQTIVSGGYDRRVLAWRYEDLKPFNYQQVATSKKPGEDGPTGTPFRAFDGHAGSLRDLSFTSDGKLLLSSSQDNTLRVWNFTTGQSQIVLRGHGGWVRAGKFLADNQTILSASHDQTIREWNLSRGEENQTFAAQVLNGHSDSVLSATFSPDRTRIVTASRDRTAKVWNVDTGQEELTLSEGHSYLASSAVFFQDNQRLVTAAVDNSARIWDVTTGAELSRLDRTGRAASLAVSPDNRWIATGGEGGQIQIWSIEGKRARILKDENGHRFEVSALAFANQGQLLVSGDMRGRLVVWDFETGQIEHVLKAHTRKINRLLVLPDGKTVLSACSDNTVGQWDVETGTEDKDHILKHPESVLTMALTPDGKTLVTSAADRIIRVWNVETAEQLAGWVPFEEPIYSIDLSADGKRLLTCLGVERTVRQWELSTGRELLAPGDDSSGPLIDLRQTNSLLWSAQYLPGTSDILTVGGSDSRLWDARTGTERLSFSPHTVVAAAQFSPDGQRIVTGSWDNTAKIWDAKTGKVIRKLTGGHTASINAVAFSPDGQTLATAGDDHRVVIWATSTGEMLRKLEHPARVQALQFSEDGQRLVTGCQDGLARLFLAATGKIQREFKGHEWGVLSVSFSKDGTRLATGSDDTTARIWETETGKEVMILRGHSAAVSSVSYSPAGERVVTGSRDQSARVWDPRTGKEILTLSLHARDITSVEFSSDGRSVLTGSRDGTAVIWPSADWSDKALKVAAKPFAD